MGLPHGPRTYGHGQPLGSAMASFDVISADRDEADRPDVKGVIKTEIEEPTPSLWFHPRDNLLCSLFITDLNSPVNRPFEWSFLTFSAHDACKPLYVADRVSGE